MPIKVQKSKSSISMACQLYFIETLYFSVWVTLGLIFFSEAHCDIRHFLFFLSRTGGLPTHEHVPRTINNEKSPNAFHCLVLFGSDFEVCRVLTTESTFS